MPKERPILFSGAMVRAILDGRKTQTRRVVKPQPVRDNTHTIELHNDGLWRGLTGKASVVYNDEEWRCPYGATGDRLWVRETWIPLTFGDYKLVTERHFIKQYQCQISYAADKYSGYREAWDDYPGQWKPSIHMPRWASRLSLEVVKVRVERLQQISHEDAIAEGIDGWIDSLPQEKRNGDVRAQRLSLKQLAYSYLWDSINADRGFGWDKNPWVWVIDFKSIEAAHA